jgi:hypothetical protein
MSLYEQRKQFKNSCQKLKQGGVKVKLVTRSTLNDYWGMNPQAAKKLHFTAIKKNELLIRRDLPPRDKNLVLEHEACEDRTMRNNGGQYFPAHRGALQHAHSGCIDALAHGRATYCSKNHRPCLGKNCVHRKR